MRLVLPKTFLLRIYSHIILLSTSVVSCIFLSSVAQTWQPRCFKFYKKEAIRKILYPSNEEAPLNVLMWVDRVLLCAVVFFILQVYLQKCFNW
jgi:hypothetical protein